MMSTMADSMDSDVDDGIGHRIKQQYESSVSLKIAAFGALVVAFAVVINFLFGMTPATEAETGLFDLWGLWASIFTIWGTAMIIVGLFAFSLVWWKRQ